MPCHCRHNQSVQCIVTNRMDDEEQQKAADDIRSVRWTAVERMEEDEQERREDIDPLPLDDLLDGSIDSMLPHLPASGLLLCAKGTRMSLLSLVKHPPNGISSILFRCLIKVYRVYRSCDMEARGLKFASACTRRCLRLLPHGVDGRGCGHSCQ